MLSLGKYFFYMRYHVRVWFQLKSGHFMFSDFAAQLWKVGCYELSKIHSFGFWRQGVSAQSLNVLRKLCTFASLSPRAAVRLE